MFLGILLVFLMGGVTGAVVDQTVPAVHEAVEKAL